MTDLYDHPQVLALLDAAKETPEDDTPRLILADWLEDHGDPKRAEFIRLQVQLSASREKDPLKQARVESLHSRYGGAWLGSLWECWLYPARWHRGLFSAGLPRSLAEEGCDTLAWIDTLFFKTTGHQSFLRLARLLEKVRPNHLFLDLGRPICENRLLEHFANAPENPWLRSLSIDWPLGLQKRRDWQGNQAGSNPTVSDDFLVELLIQVPMCKHLRYMASLPDWSLSQADLIRLLGVEPVSIPSRLWMHSLPPSCFKARPNPT